MDEEWDAEGKELPVPPAVVGQNKWEGEDEEEEVKESWEDEEEEEKKDVEKTEQPKATQLKKPKKIRAEKIEEKERKLQEELDRKAKMKEEQQQELTPAELQAEKLRQQKLQEEADLLVARETFGTAESSSGTGIDAMNPTTEEEFEELQNALTKKINSCCKSSYFPSFAEELIRNICVNLSSNDLKKLKTTVENMFLEKSKIEKGDKAKKNKGKGKVKLRVEGENVSSATLVNDYYNELDEFDDFM